MDLEWSSSLFGVQDLHANDTASVTLKKIADQVIVHLTCVDASVSVSVRGEDLFWSLQDLRNMTVDLLRDALIGGDSPAAIVSYERVVLWNE